MLSPMDDYLDGDVAYLIGLIVARGSISNVEGARSIVIHFPYRSLEVEVRGRIRDQGEQIRLGIEYIRDRLTNLLDVTITTTHIEGDTQLVIPFARPSMIWRNILYILNNATSHPYFTVPPAMFHPDVPRDWKREFVRGYADVAGNVRSSNNYVDGRNRVRLDVLNYPSNWEVAVQLCSLIQGQLGVPVQLITYGHPNMGRAWKEHQLNIFVEPFLGIGFTFQHKQAILEQLAAQDGRTNHDYHSCPGRKVIRRQKPHSPGEADAEKLDTRLVGYHADSYWQICKRLGCPLEPQPSDQLLMDFGDEEAEV